MEEYISLEKLKDFELAALDLTEAIKAMAFDGKLATLTAEEKHALDWVFGSIHDLMTAKEYYKL